MPARIEDYALIGDCQTAALVARDGSIDWLCLPRFDSGACFAALLGGPGNGRWLLTPAGDRYEVKRSYEEDTLVLRTEFTTAEGSVAMTDFMPARGENPILIRLVEGISGAVRMHMELVLRFDYGTSVPWVTRLKKEHGLQAVAGPNMVVLRTRVPVRGKDHTSVADFVVGEGESIPFVLAYGSSFRDPPPAVDAHGALAHTRTFWKSWIDQSSYDGEWRDAVRRSLITLKALTYAPTGAIVAAPTTSLPERLHGVRNWDYRYCWLRDATLTLLAFMNAGYFGEAESWRRWLLRAVAGSPEQIQIMYGLAGERRLSEWEVAWLPGYQGASPVRVGNSASGQRQLDVYGEVMDALHHGRLGGITEDAASWAIQRKLLDALAQLWMEPDEGIWEVRGKRQHFTYSKVMAWVAFDRAIKAVERFGLDGPVERWRRLRGQIHEEVCARAYDPGRGSFVQSYGSEVLDACLLLIPTTGFLPPSDPRVIGTLRAVEKDLLADGFLLRYRTLSVDDGLPPEEGAFLACSFWLADNYVLQGQLDKARALFERLLSIRNDLGLLAEEYDPGHHRLLGNFPQAFSHIALVNTAMNLTRASGPARQRAKGERAVQ